MTNDQDLAGLPEDVREAVHWLIGDADGMRPATDHVRCVRATLLRLAREVAELRDQLATEKFSSTVAIGSWKDSYERAEAELAALKALINTPETDQWLRAVHIEAVHQVERWGTSHDRAKRPADWFWLVGYLAGKALHSATAGNTEKAKHHTISTAAALYNWHCAITGRDVRMCPGRSDLAEMVESQFPGETTDASTAREVQ